MELDGHDDLTRVLEDGEISKILQKIYHVVYCSAKKSNGANPIHTPVYLNEINIHLMCFLKKYCSTKICSVYPLESENLFPFKGAKYGRNYLKLVGRQ